jgi:iron complex outermembrane recepter protein
MAIYSHPKATFRHSQCAYAAALCVASIANVAWAQAPASDGTVDAALKPVTVSSRNALPTADVTGFGDTPLKDLPAAVTVVDSVQIQNSGARRLADLTAFDASVTDSYNSPGYWDFLSIRGFTLDNRFNYRREGLPISAETSIPLENKERVEILKGTSGIQAGTSAPGGLVNYMVKRPTEQNLRAVRIEWTSRNSVLTALDLGGRLGVDRVFGYRFNVAHEEMRPVTQNLNGKRDLVALATDWRVSRDTLVEAELEWSRKSQPSQMPYSLLGNALPAPVDPRLNLNNQAWSQPSVFDALTGSLRIEQALGMALGTDWRWSAQLGSQRLRTDDRAAFGFGCDAEGNYDRYCKNGTFDLYDFRSENERRVQTAANAKLKGKVTTGGITHDLTFGVTRSQVKNRYQMQAYNYVGVANVQGTLQSPADPTLGDQNTNRDETSLELSASDVIRWTPRLSTWLGLRSTSLTRDSVRTNGTRATHYDANLLTPWFATSYALNPTTTAYASYGEGVESQIVPNKASQYTNAGVALPALKSRQFELGLKGAYEGVQAGTQAGTRGDTLHTFTWQAAAFRINRPMSNLDACNSLGIAPCQGAYDGQAVHTGLELSGQWAQGPWRVNAGATALRARREGSTLEPTTNGQRPTNVPERVLRAQTSYRVPSIAGLELSGQVQHEGSRAVLPDNSVTLPAWTRLDASLRYTTKAQGTTLVWSAGVDNLTDKRYWKEAPYQYGHVYLFPGAARTFRIGLSANL